jgi:ADP-sugar diphosphatase
VGMMIILQPDDIPQFKENGNGKKERNDDDKWVILTVQPRVPAGGLQFVELPAGMVDGGTFGGSAAKEIREELGLSSSRSHFIFHYKLL